MDGNCHTHAPLTGLLILEPVVHRAGTTTNPVTWLAKLAAGPQTTAFTSAYQAQVRLLQAQLYPSLRPPVHWREAPFAVRGPVSLKLGGVELQLFVGKRPWEM
jgi:hypothetical protein